ncbi:MAG TPA: 4-hydroxy-3-methylbut-2-enyl diphosphate reductase [Rhodospirillaceae bacterium]|nr:4-hydroxy-3-methylbut-2-enyl diphosphate reductase [Rhodospirillaceae bacterium]
MTNLPPLKILLAAPRGFCAGVDRAVQMVERALEKYGAPVYVRHEIVHNRRVVDGLAAKGAVFVKELHEIPEGTKQPVIFSAHGVAKSVPENATNLNLFVLDATCPLVSKVHREAERHHANGRRIILVGHAGHPEVIGTMGQLPAGAVTLIETREDAERLQIENTDQLAYVTQTTLSVDDTAEVVATLQQRFPNITGPYKEDICYATTNRQGAVKMIAKKCDAMVVLGAPNSSNSNRLVEVALAYGSPRARLVQNANELDIEFLSGAQTLGLTAGASAPEELVQEVIAAIGKHYTVTVEEVRLTDEDVTFKLPRALTQTEAA